MWVCWAKILNLVDGGKDLDEALPFAYGDVPAQRCWAHKTHNVLNNVKKVDHNALRKIFTELTIPISLGMLIFLCPLLACSQQSRRYPTPQ